MLNRDQNLSTLRTEAFDLLIIGGGATGAGIALDAASRGIKTALVEKGDFASGTSSKSTKLIHGGLRYLKQFAIDLVRESGTERAVVNKVAPHLCLPEKMLLPLVKGGTFGKWSSSVGLFVYDFLAGVDADDKRKMLNKKQTLKKEPLLDANKVVGGGYYAEYRTDDARLTIELIKKAGSYGAVAVNYSKMTDFIHSDGIITGVVIEDMITGEQIQVDTRRVVSAAGPWVDHIRAKNQSLNHKKLHLTKGVHLVFPRAKFPIKQSIYFDEPGGRMLFAIPRGRVTYLGTTDTTYTGDKDRIVATTADRDYLLAGANGAFPDIKLTADDVISNWMGLRPLIHEEGKSTSEISRKDEIFTSDDGLISIAGGKLTGYRKMAERIVDLVIDKDGLNVTHKDAITDEIPLGADTAMTNKEVKKYIQELSDRISAKGLDPYYGWYLVTNYGRQAERILSVLSESATEVELAESEIRYNIAYEMVTRAADYFVRRTGRLYFDIESIAHIRQPVMDIMSQELNWDDHRLQQENAILDSLITDATSYYDQEIK